uniref:Uncharacterized protein n=1 Tax=Anguilla anguilla TaxID=7936 RepID=A0A0E9VQW7_ANGAN
MVKCCEVASLQGKYIIFNVRKYP